MDDTITGTVNQLPPLLGQIDQSSPFLREWMIEAVRRLDALCGMSLNNAPAFVFSQSNAAMVLGVSGSVILPAQGAGGTAGLLKFENGVVTYYLAPT